MLRILAIILLLVLISAVRAQAIYDPLSQPNNRFGIHIIDENDLQDAANLVNSSGGDWGYVKIVIREDDRNLEKWQAIFDRMRKMHLIPLVRLATKVENGVWIKPREADLDSWVEFLAKLNWVIENRYVIIFNEPNHAQEWGGEVDPKSYAWFLKEFSSKLKERSEDFFILPAGLDASAPNGFDTLDEVTFLQRLVAAEPEIFKSIDGWTSHSYPNPDFSGSPLASGRGSVRTFAWELNLLENYGVNNLPIFITETGWQHSDGIYRNRRFATPDQVAQNYITAFTNAWSDPRIVVVTPFLLNYQGPPFDYFSFRKLNSSEFFPMYLAIQNLAKTAATPKQLLSAKILADNFPGKLVTGSDYILNVDIENTGQALIDSQDGWQLTLTGLPKEISVTTSNIFAVEPFHRTRVEIHLKTSKSAGFYNYEFILQKNRTDVAKSSASLSLVAPPSLLVTAKTWINRLAQGHDFSLLIYDEQERLLKEAKNLAFDQGLAQVDELYDIVPNRKYRLVLTKPYYLPRQIYAKLSESATRVTFPVLLPLDPSNDGALTWDDAKAFFKKPLETFGLLIAL